MTDEQKYQAIVRENPEVEALVQDLGLVNPRTGLPYGVEAVSQENRLKLSSIAGRLLNRGRIYSSEQVLLILESGLKVSRQRAVRGLEMMLTSGVLVPAYGAGVCLM